MHNDALRTPQNFVGNFDDRRRLHEHEEWEISSMEEVVLMFVMTVTVMMKTMMMMMIDEDQS